LMETVRADFLSRDAHWQQIVIAHDETWRLRWEEQRRSDDSWRIQLRTFVEQWHDEVKRVADWLVTRGSNLYMTRHFPVEQKATHIEVLACLMPLLTVAYNSFPQMTYDVWKQVRIDFGKAVKKERLLRHALGECSADYIDRPLLWTFVGEGTQHKSTRRHYVVLREHRDLVELVWTAPRTVGRGRRRRVESLDAEARRLQATAAARPGYVAEAWPLHPAEVEPIFESSSEEE